MTDTIEAVKRAHKLLGKLPRPDFDDVLALLESERSRAITAHTKALIEGAGEVVVKLRARARLTDLQANQDAFLEAAATIATLRAEFERLTRAAALSDLIAGDADLIVPDTLADSDGDDGA